MRTLLTAAVIAASITVPAHAKGPIGDAILGVVRGPQPTVDQTLTKLVADVTKEQGLPKMIDPETRWTSVFTVGKIFGYNYVLTQWNASELDVNYFVKNMTPVQMAKCSSAALQPLFRRGVTVQFNFSGKDGKPIKAWDLTPALCGVTPQGRPE